MNSNEDQSLPILGHLTILYASSFLIVVLMAVASVVGLVSSAVVYPSDAFVRAFVPNDVVNLVLGLPIILISMWLTRRRRLAGPLCWVGALFFVLYNYLIYLFALPFQWAFLLHLSLVAMSAYSLVGLLLSIDGNAVRQRLMGVVPEKLGGGVLAGLGLLFFLRILGVLIPALSQGEAVPEAELAVHIADFLITPAWVIVGVLLWRRRVLGYVMGLGMLFQASSLFIALIIFLLIQPLLTAAPFAASDAVVIFIMGLLCFIPMVLFVRGALAKRGAPSS